MAPLCLSNLLLSLPPLPSAINRHNHLLSLETSQPPNPKPPTIAALHSEASSAIPICFPSLSHANIFFFNPADPKEEKDESPKPAATRHFNVQIIVGEHESEDSLLRRFRRKVMNAGILQECRRRRFFEDSREKRKRKARDAARRRNRSRAYYVPRAKQKSDGEAKEKKKEEEEDNWELPEGELPY